MGCTTTGRTRPSSPAISSVPLLLILDDDRARLGGFEQIAQRLGQGWTVKGWRDAPGMIADLERHLDEAGLVSLDNDLYKDLDGDPGPGSGRAVAEHLSKLKPACPVIVHSTNTDAAWGMHNALRSGGWTVELVHHLNQPRWIEELWLPVAARLVAPAGTPPAPRDAALTLADYRALVRKLWLPAVEQQRSFAEYVAGAHSWYKHLRVLPASTPMQLFIDPAAGLQFVQAPDGRVSAGVREKPGFHYSWLPTAEYRRRFGYLAFSRSAGTRVSLIGADGRQLIPSDDQPRIHDPATGAFHALPEEVLMAGRAYVSGIVHADASSRYIWEHVIAGTEDFDRVLDPIDGLEIGKRILDRCAVLKKDPARAQPSPHGKGNPGYEFSLASLDVPLDELVKEERKRQIGELSAAAGRVVRLVGRSS